MQLQPAQPQAQVPARARPQTEFDPLGASVNESFEASVQAWAQRLGRASAILAEVGADAAGAQRSIDAAREDGVGGMTGSDRGDARDERDDAGIRGAAIASQAASMPPMAAVDVDQLHAQELRTRGPVKATVEAATSEASGQGSRRAGDGREGDRAAGGSKSEQPREGTQARSSGESSERSALAGSTSALGAARGGTNQSNQPGMRDAGNGAGSRVSGVQGVSGVGGAAGAKATSPAAGAAGSSAAAGAVRAGPGGAPSGSATGVVAGNTLDRPQALRGLLQKTAPALARQAEQTPVRQLAAALASALRKGEGSVTLRLSPEHLGPMRVELGLTAGEVSARFHPTTKSARDLLIGSESSLRSALEARGLDVARIEIAALPDQGGVPARDGVDAAGRGEDPRMAQEHAGAGGRGDQENSAHAGGFGDSSGSRDADGARANTWALPTDEEVAEAVARLEGIAPALGELGVSMVRRDAATGRIEAIA